MFSPRCDFRRKEVMDRSIHTRHSHHFLRSASSLLSLCFVYKYIHTPCNYFISAAIGVISLQRSTKSNFLQLNFLYLFALWYRRSKGSSIRLFHKADRSQHMKYNLSSMNDKLNNACCSHDIDPEKSGNTISVKRYAENAIVFEMRMLEWSGCTELLRIKWEKPFEQLCATAKQWLLYTFCMILGKNNKNILKEYYKGTTNWVPTTVMQLRFSYANDPLFHMLSPTCHIPRKKLLISTMVMQKLSQLFNIATKAHLDVSYPLSFSVMIAIRCRFITFAQFWTK